MQMDPPRCDVGWALCAPNWTFRQSVALRKHLLHGLFLLEDTPVRRARLSTSPNAHMERLARASRLQDVPRGTPLSVEGGNVRGCCVLSGKALYRSGCL